MPVFVVDANFFINAHRDTYPLDVAHSFWNKVKILAADGKIISIDKVREEIYGYNEDELQIWCNDNLDSNFLKILRPFFPQPIRMFCNGQPHEVPNTFNVRSTSLWPQTRPMRFS